MFLRQWRFGTGSEL